MDNVNWLFFFTICTMGTVLLSLGLSFSISPNSFPRHNPPNRYGFSFPFLPCSWPDPGLFQHLPPWGNGRFPPLPKDCLQAALLMFFFVEDPAPTFMQSFFVLEVVFPRLVFFFFFTDRESFHMGPIANYFFFARLSMF